MIESSDSSASDDLKSEIPTEKETKPKETKPKQTNRVTDKTDSNKNDSTTNNNNNNNNNNKNNTADEDFAPPESLKDINNGILKEAYADCIDVPENMKYLGTSNATEENNSKTIKATVALYVLDGDVVNWTTENDLIYVITQGNNRLVVIDSKTMHPLYNTPLAGVPAEMSIVGDSVYISLPDLCKIDVFSKADCKKTSSLYFDHEVSSFSIEGDYIYYSEHTQHCKVFKKNLTTNEEVTVPRSTYHDTFYYPKVYLNKEDRILCIGESHSSGSKLLYYNADTLELIGIFEKNDYGIYNNTREMFHIGDTIYWGNYAISDTNPKQLIGKYGTDDAGSLVYVSEELVSTHEGLFLTDTYECIIDYYDAKFDFKSLIITDSYNIFFRNTSLDKNMIIGINFDLQ